MPNYDSSNNSHLVEKIAIPVGAVVGTITVGGVTYYLCKKRKSKQSRQVDNQNDGNQLFELVNVSQPIVKSENTGQPVPIPETVEQAKDLGMPVN